MFGTVVNFVRYNNAFPIALAVLFLGAGGVLAASPDLRNDVYASESSTVSVDNSYIANKNLDTYTPSIQITNVTEDADNYFVAYTLKTIDLQDGSWQDVTRDKTLTVSKAALNGKDLGLYVTGQLAELSSYELSRLRDTQAIEKEKGVTQKVVATTYSGLIGKFLDAKEETLPGYIPVIPEPVAPVAGNSSESISSSPVLGSGDVQAPTLTVLGNNPARITLNTSYSDLGAVVQDNLSENLGYSVLLDGVQVPDVVIDTSVVGTHTVVYTAVDQAGNSASASRSVIVYDPYAAVSTTTDTTASSPDTSSSTSTESVPAVEANASTTPAVQ